MDEQKIDEMMERIKNDKRSKNEVFKSIADQLVKDYNIPKEKSFDAAHNLIGFYERILKMVPQDDKE